MECEHPACVCLVDNGPFCSDHCRDLGSEPGDACGCGHPECAAMGHSIGSDDEPILPPR